MDTIHMEAAEHGTALADLKGAGINQYKRLLPVIEPVVYFFVRRIPCCKNIYETFYFLCVWNPIMLLVSSLFPCEFLDRCFAFFIKR